MSHTVMGRGASQNKLRVYTLLSQECNIIVTCNTTSTSTQKRFRLPNSIPGQNVFVCTYQLHRITPAAKRLHPVIETNKILQSALRCFRSCRKLRSTSVALESNHLPLHGLQCMRLPACEELATFLHQTESAVILHAVQ